MTVVIFFAFLLTLGLIYRTAKRRGGRGYLWVTFAIIGYLLTGFTFTYILYTPLYNLIQFGWLGLCLLAAFYLTGGIQQHATSWTCRDCGLLNDPSTLVCGCGHRPIIGEL